MLSQYQSLPAQFLSQHGTFLLAVSFAWALLITFLFSNGWRRSRHLIVQILEMGITATMITVMMYLPFIVLALGVRWGWL